MAKLRPDSLLELTFLSDPQLSPDGRSLVAVSTIIEPGKGEGSSYQPPRYHSRLVLYQTDGSGHQVFTQGTSDSKPRFSPDGSKLAFLAKRSDDKQPQLYLMSLSGGEAERLTQLKSGVSSFVWHPDSQQLAFISRGDWEDRAAQEERARVIERMHYKSDGRGFRPSEIAQVYLISLGDKAPRRLSSFAANPSELAFHPDGQSLYVCAATCPADEDRWHSGLWQLPATGGEAALMIDSSQMVSDVAPSPDGAGLALMAPAEPGNLASPVGLWLWQGGRLSLLTGELDAQPGIGGDSRYGDSPNRPAWSEDSRSLVINVNRAGRSALSRVSLASGNIRALHSGDRAVTAFSYAAGRLAFLAETPSRPGELFTLGRGRETQLSQVNTDFVARYRLAEATEHTTRAERGPRLTYWTLAPRKPRKDKALVLQVHGGPHTNYGYGFYFEFQLLAARGYTVAYGNPRGSTSYGSGFAQSILGGYGTIDSADVLAIADSARASHTDSEAPIHLAGGSYGGFMTNWLITQTAVFRSAVTQRSICNWLSFYGTSDIGYRFSEYEVGGNPWADTDKLWAQSPLKHVANVTTPLLIIHSEEDHRCPIEQAEQFYIALKRIGKAEVRFIRFPDECHELSRSGRPDRRIERLKAIVDWFETHP
ncbi:MAG: S9 family peptidase [Truepera sp.]|nr:S9 family peptidase [Truepera sp.]